MRRIRPTDGRVAEGRVRARRSPGGHQGLNDAPDLRPQPWAWRFDRQGESASSIQTGA